MLMGLALGIGLASNGILANGNQTSGFAFGGRGGAAAQQLRLTLVDDAGHAVLDPSASYTLTSSDPSRIVIAPVTGKPGLFTLTPLSQTSVPMILTASASAPHRATVHASSSLELDAILYVGNAGANTVTVYAPWSASPILTIPATEITNPVAMTLDSMGNLYVANYDARSVAEFAPGSATAIHRVTGLDEPIALAVDASGNLFVSNYGNEGVDEFAPGDTRTPSRILSRDTSPGGISSPVGLAVDTGGNLYVANWDAVGVSIFAPGSSTAPVTSFTTGISNPWALALDPAGNLYALNHSGEDVTVYAWPFSKQSTPFRILGSTDLTVQPEVIALDPFGNVYIGNESGGLVVEFAPNGSVVRTLPGGVITRAIAVDALGNLYIHHDNPSDVSIYPPGPTTTPSSVIREGLDHIASMAVWP
jgi:hypothetical protein